MTAEIESFRHRFPDAALADLRIRLKATRWPDAVEGVGWDYGMNPAVLRDYVGYWADRYDWRAREAEIAALQQFTTEIDGLTIHFVHVRARRAGGAAVPLMLLHGWPGSFLQMRPLIPLLVDPPAGKPAFNVIVPSLPGFGFSSIPRTPGMSAPRIAPILHRLMTERLGYSRFGLRSSDLGAGIATRIAADHPESIIGSHTGGTNPWLGQVPSDLSSEEQRFVAYAQAWGQQEMAYAMLHSSKPQTLAAALNDSPSGLAAWLLEKYWRWGDTSKTLDERYGRDALLDTLTLYWCTGTIAASMRLYYETARDPNAWARADVPTAMLMSPHDMFPTPRRWVERQGRVDRWTEIDRGGHFLEWEVPNLVAEDIRAFFASLA